MAYQPGFSVCRSVNFHERQGEECLAANVEAVLDIVRENTKNMVSMSRPMSSSKQTLAPTVWAS